MAGCDTMCIVTSQSLAPDFTDVKTISVAVLLTWAGFVRVSGLTGSLDFFSFLCGRFPSVALKQWDTKPDRNGEIRCLVFGEDCKVDSNHTS